MVCSTEEAGPAMLVGGSISAICRVFNMSVSIAYFKSYNNFVSKQSFLCPQQVFCLSEIIIIIFFYLLCVLKIYHLTAHFASEILQNKLFSAHGTILSFLTKVAVLILINALNAKSMGAGELTRLDHDSHADWAVFLNAFHE